MKLLMTMRDYCRSLEEEVKLEREIAEGFWFISHFVRDWTTHEGFRNANKLPEEYYIEAYELIYHLSWWYFTNDCPFISEDDFNEELEHIESLYAKRD